MNERLEAAMPERLEDAPTLRLEELANADLKGQDLTKFNGLLPEHLAGADLTGARLPDEIAKFPALGQVAAISSEARKIFIGLLAACVYSWLVIGTTKDDALIANTASSPLPIINTPIPIAGFYVIGGTLLAAVYGYFHFYLQRLWRTLATLPAIFPDGTPLDDRTDPWLLTNLVRADFKHLRRTPPPLAGMENLLTILLAWWLVPLTLLALWVGYLPAHYWRGTSLLVALIGVTAMFGRHSYRLARATLRGEAPAATAEGAGGHAVSGRAWHEFRQIRPDRLTVGVIAVLIVCSLSAFLDNPRASYTWLAEALNVVGVQAGPLGLAEGLNAVRIRTYADVREVNFAVRPAGWDGKDWTEVKRIDLRGRDLAFADAPGTFLPNAELRGARLTNADLGAAQLQGANLREAQLQAADLEEAQLQGANLREAQLQDANLEEAQLQGANLREAQLQGANLREAQLQAADLVATQLQGANLGFAQLQGANLGRVQLRGADLAGAQLQGADLRGAQLRGADLRGAQLQGADLREAQLQDADLRSAALWRALVDEARWNYGDLRGAHVHPISDAAVDNEIAAVTKGIPDEARREAVEKRLNEVLRTEKRPARPNFPEKWRSEPNVMFDQSDPAPEPFEWGTPSWATQNAYDKDLATFLGDLACASDVDEALTRGLARRAIYSEDRMWRTLFAARLIGPDCPPAKGLPDRMRSELEALAARRAVLPDDRGKARPGQPSLRGPFPARPRHRSDRLAGAALGPRRRAGSAVTGRQARLHSKAPMSIPMRTAEEGRERTLLVVPVKLISTIGRH
jgi:uncharacterized protein YjbI with pentapeptide repeats